MRPSPIGIRTAGAVSTRDPEAAIVLRTDMRALAELELREAVAVVDDEVGRAAGNAFRTARNAWPVDSGLSRASLSIRQLGPLHYRVADPVPYAWAIKARGGPAAETLLRTPIAQAVGDALARAEKRHGR